MKLLTRSAVGIACILVGMASPSIAYDRSELLFDNLSPNHACNNGTAPEGHLRDGAFCDTANNPKPIDMGKKKFAPALVVAPTIPTPGDVVIPDEMTDQEKIEQHIRDEIQKAKEAAEQWARDRAAEIAEAKRKARERFCSRSRWC